MVYIDADLTNESSIKKALAQAVKAFGGIDGLVNVPPPPPACHSKTNGVLLDLDLQVYQVPTFDYAHRSHRTLIGFDLDWPLRR